MSCKKHPSYKAFYKPENECSHCYRLYAETLEQREKKNSNFNSSRQIPDWKREFLDSLGNYSKYEYNKK